MAHSPRFSTFLTVVVAALAAAVMVACELFGGSTETGNTLSGVILEEEAPPSKVAATRLAGGGGKENIRVNLYAKDWDPVFGGPIPVGRTTLTDKEGRYVFRNVEPGIYNIEAKAADGSGIVLIPGVLMPEGGGQSLTANEGVLKPSGVIRIPLEDVNVVDGYFYLPGTGAYGLVDSAAKKAGVISVKPVAPGTYASILQNSTGRIATDVLSNPVSVIAGENRILDPSVSGWKLRRKIFINTSPSGVEIAEALIGFPLLVRLDPSNFDFAEADSQGHTLRFTKADAITPVSFEVDRWDVARRTAEVWVLVDTLFPGSADQFLYLYSGKAGTAVPSAYRTVFDTGAGFAGVWHLGGDIMDATPNRNDGIDSGTQEEDGIIGSSRYFDAASRYIQIPNHSSLNLGTGDFTLSAYFRLDALPAGYMQLLIKREVGNSNYEIQVSQSVEGAVDSANQVSAIEGSTVLQQDQWYQVSLTRKDGWVSLYLDGLPDAKPLYKPFNAGGNSDLFMGIDPFQTQENLQGSMDEVRVSRVCRSPTWIRFAFETGMPGSTAVKVGLPVALE